MSSNLVSVSGIWWSTTYHRSSSITRVVQPYHTARLFHIQFVPGDSRCYQSFLSYPSYASSSLFDIVWLFANFICSAKVTAQLETGSPNLRRKTAQSRELTWAKNRIAEEVFAKGYRYNGINQRGGPKPKQTGRSTGFWNGSCDF